MKTRLFHLLSARRWRLTVIAALLLSAFALITYYVALPPPAQGVSTTIVISQVYGGGGNTGATYKNDFVELFNRGNTTVNVTGWSVQYTSAAGTFGGASPNITVLSGSIAPGQYYLIQEAQGAGGTTNLPTPDAMGTIAMSATAGKVALVNNSTALAAVTCPTSANIIDFIGYGTTANCFEGGSAAPALTNTTAALRANNGCTDTDSNSADFTAGAPTPRNSASPTNACGSSGPTNPSGVGAANPSAVPPGSSTLLTVTVTPGSNPTSTGLTVTGDLTAIGGSATQQFFDNATNGDVTANDNVFSFSATVAGGTTAGAKSLPVSIADAQSRTGSTSISLTVSSALAIHDIQGSGTTSPVVSQVVTTSGIVTGVRSNGFFIQEPDATVDANSNTSEGIFVFTSSAPPAAAAVGNKVAVTGTVQEFIPSADPLSPPVTEISGSPTVTLVSTGNPLPTPVTLTSADTGTGGTNSGSIENLEKYEGMRVLVASLTVVAPTQGSVNEPNATSTSNGVFYGVISGVARPFREPGIQANDPVPAGSGVTIPPVPRFDFNPERIRVNSLGLVGSSAIEVTAGATVTNLVGPLDYSFRTYTILPDPATPPVASGNVSATPVPMPDADEFTIASFNMERFFDTTDDPTIGEPVLTATAFNNRLNKASLAIRNVMRSPDIIGVEEMENLTTLQAVATQVNNDTFAATGSNPNYQAFLVEGNDVGGIDVGFLVKTSRVTVVDVTQFGKTTTYINPNNSQPELLNDRPPLVLRATITAPDTSQFPITVIVNHLRSLSGIDSSTDGNRVRTKRRAQAEFLADLIQQRQTADPTERIISIGDYNAFQVNDGYVDTIGTIKGTPTPPDQVVLASSDLVNPDLYDLVNSAPADQRYSFSFDGTAQVLDHELITTNLLSRFNRISYARNNADFPESFRNDATRPERISDHDMPVSYFKFTQVTTASCAYSLSPPANSFPAGGGTGNFLVQTGGECTWAAVSNATWITLTPPASGRGVGAVAYSVGPNPETFARTGTITVADKSFTITQATDCALTLSATSQSFAAHGGSGSVTVSGGQGCAWTATTTDYFIHITGSGNGTVSYTVDTNTAYGRRSGTISVAGQAFSVLQGAAFIDVPLSHPLYTEIGKLSARGITNGCGVGSYCPESSVTREQMAIFITRALGEFNPPQPATRRFLDVGPERGSYPFIDDFARRGITAGCGGGNFCPDLEVTRGPMAAFILRALGVFNPETNVPQRFFDVPASNPFYGFIDQMAVRGITKGCGGGNYCPDGVVNRGQMAAFLVRAFGL